MKVLVRSLLCNNSAFSGQSVVEFGKEFADVGVFNLDARAALVEQYRPLAVAFRQATQRLGGDAAGSAMQLKAICPDRQGQRCSGRASRICCVVRF